MQVQHEATLIECLPLKSQDFVSANLESRSLDTYALNQNPLKPIDHIASSPAHNLIAVHISGSNHIVIYDLKSRLRRDRFPLKACDKRYSKQSFSVTGLDFSPDGSRLAVGQTDCIIYVYKLPNYSQQSTSLSTSTNVSSSSMLSTEPTLPNPSATSLQSSSTTIKPIITGKFASSSPVSCLKWSEWGIVFGCQDGKTKIILLPAPNSRQMQLQQQQLPQQPQPSENIPAKVSTVHTAPKDIVPISLTCRASVLAIGFIDNTVRVVCLNPDTAMQDYHQLSLLGEATSGGSRRSSSIAQQYQSSIAQTSDTPNFSLAATLEHTCPASCIALIQSASTLCLAGSDGRISLNSIKIEPMRRETSVNNYGSLMNDAQQSIATTRLRPIELKEDVVALDYSSVNEIMTIATKSKLLFLKLDQATSSWQIEKSHIECKNLFSITSVAWSRDGSHLCVGTSNGSLELFRCSWIKHSINDQLDICLIAKNRVRITDKARNLLATYKTQHEIKRVNLLDNGQSVIVWTSSSLLLARMDLQLQSEIAWPYGVCDKLARFTFTDALGFVLIARRESNEIFVVILGLDMIVYSSRLDLNRSTVSLRRFPPPNMPNAEPSLGSQRLSLGKRASATPQTQQVNNAIDELSGNESPTIKLVEADVSNEEEEVAKKSVELLAFVVGKKQLRLVNLRTKSELKFVEHDQDITSLKLSHSGRYLSLLDALGRLYLLRDITKLFDLNESEVKLETIAVLLIGSNGSYANWIDGTDILIAQSESRILVWYDLEWHHNRAEKIDTMKLNITNEIPLLDLSLVESESSTDRQKKHPVIVKMLGSELELSNGQRVKLDASKIKFFREVTADRLDKALELLEKSTDRSLSELLQRLGWLALERGNISVAKSAFGSAKMSKICYYLHRCTDEMSLEQSSLKIAMLCGQWDKFEQLNDGNQETIVWTYKRLNKWNRLIEYLTRMQQVRQRDMVEKEFQEWLISRNRFIQAAQVSAQSSSGDLMGAVSLLMKYGKYKEACDFVLEENRKLSAKKPLHSSRLISSVADLEVQLIQANELSRAAKLNEKMLDNKTKALDLYIQAKEFESALSLAKSIGVGVNKERELEQTYAGHLLNASKESQIAEQSRRLTLKAVKHLVAADECAEALRLAVSLSEFDVAYNILMKLTSNASLSRSMQQTSATREDAKDVHQSDSHQSDSLEQVSEQCKQVAEYMRRIGRLDEALRAFRAAGGKSCVGQVVELELERGNIGAAYRSALDDLYDGDRTRVESEFVQYANSLVERATGGNDESLADLALERAEQIYLQLDRVDLAVKAYERAERFDRMLQLIGEHQSDQLEGALLQLARRMEACGQFEEAEKYLLRASESEWTNVVRMYRLANKWPEAYRVAREHCASELDPLLVQLAYWWAKSIVVSGAAVVDTGSTSTSDTLTCAPVSDGSSSEGELASSIEKARQLLERLRVLVQVVEFSCENKNFQLAIDLSKGIESLQRDCVRRYATYLEQQHKFDRAEQVLLEHNLVELAARMYLDNGKHTDAVRVVEQRMHQAATGLPVAGSLKSTNDNNNGSLKFNDILIECAERISEEVAPVAEPTTTTQLRSARARSKVNEQLTLAQQVFLRAQRPDLAVEMYVKRGLWQDAMQVAQRFAPKLVESVERALDEQVGDDMDSIVASVTSKSDVKAASAAEQTQAQQDIETPRSLPVDNEQPSATGISSIEVQRRQVEAKVQSKDRRATRQAFASFMETATSDLAALSSDQQLEERLASIERSLRLTCEPNEPMAAMQATKRPLLLEWLFLQRATGDTKQLDENPSWQRLVFACDFVMSSCDWGSLAATGTTLTHAASNKMSIWLRLRNILELCVGALATALTREQLAQKRSFAAISEKNGFKLDPNLVLVAQLERRLLVVHFVVLMNSLASFLLAPDGSTNGQLRSLRGGRPTGAIAQMEHLLESIVARDSSANSLKINRDNISGLLIGLAFRLSHALLRYTDLIEARAALLQAALWSIAVRCNDLAQVTLKRALELETKLGSSKRIEEQSSSTHAELMRLLVDDLPEPSRMKLSRAMQIASSTLVEARQWLLESTIGVRSKWSNEVESHPIAMAVLGATKVRSARKRHPTLSGVCLVSGVQIETLLAAQQQQASLEEVRSMGLACTGAQCFVHERDWQLLVDLASQWGAQTKQTASQRQRQQRRSPESSSSSSSLASSTSMQLAGERLSDVAEFLRRLIRRAGGS